MEINTPYLFEHPFEIEDLIKDHKQAMIDKFIYDKIDGNKTGTGYNTGYENYEFDVEIGKRFVHAIDQCFVINRDIVVEQGGLVGTINPGKGFTPVRAWIYCQNDEHFASERHTHISTSTINAVTYIDIPEKGGALELDIMGNVVELYPDPNKIYFFPYWVVHRPLPQKDKRWRICINLEFYDNNRALRKNGVRW
jgi:hypothetical protein